MRLWLLGALGLLSLSLAGCDSDQIQVIQVAPPGAVIPRKPPEGDDVAQAQGETVTASARNAERGGEVQKAQPTPVGQSITLEGGLNYETVKAGTGEELTPGRVGVINYEGTLDDGTVFDTTKKRGTPAEFTFGTNKLIPGWERAVPGMKVGEIRKLTIPPLLGYKDEDKKGIPPNSTLHFEIELVGVK
ncbi:FKBP-type peptidyl-prolyl cis-trans isomerase [Paludisphaera borealis]|uniref:Peptidyl-prolyl cis-trans isomerase n=1 Tax=Paludisphaera borealis TaxID=1387353 RepID=A0A1U7CXH4_9BACT|nr:FKBP-type peptidyl-prolyl cis-trans isomerase [Paludisphaera borealis]APW63644.1 Peptidyl-prolyl cis-trans isomerase Mip [Paludisphaera borealis]MDR3622101.1 FKBP-type peptidyl-prolyl cis-trans isomerase [Paludisphaera borealis]